MLALARGFNSGVERLRSTRHRRRPIFKLTYVYAILDVYIATNHLLKLNLMI